MLSTFSVARCFSVIPRFTYGGRCFLNGDNKSFCYLCVQWMKFFSLFWCCFLFLPFLLLLFPSGCFLLVELHRLGFSWAIILYGLFLPFLVGWQGFCFLFFCFLYLLVFLVEQGFRAVLFGGDPAAQLILQHMTGPTVIKIETHWWRKFRCLYLG